ncbi:MAG: HlyC/CorC family transporter [bacterium]|nr:HlyC/CorC family transporter [bacterium]
MAESALFSLGDVRLGRMLHHHKFGARAVNALLRNPRRLLVTIIIGNMFVNIVASSLAATLAISINPEYGPIVSMVVITIIVFVFCEIIPKSVGVISTERASGILAPGLRSFNIILFPVSWAVSGISDYLTGKQAPREMDLSPEDVIALLGESEADGVLDNVERAMIERVVELKYRGIKEIFTPRTSIVALEANTPRTDIFDLAISTAFSRIPVYSGDMEDVSGILYVKDFLVAGFREPINLKDIIRPVLYFPENKPIMEVFYEFRYKKQHIAMVVDEYGSISGLVTMDDLLGEITGRVHNGLRGEEYVSLGEGNFIVRGDMAIDDFNRLFPHEIYADDFETVAGFVIKHLGKVPQRGERLEYDGMIMQVMDARPNKVERVWVKRTERT